MAVIESFFGLDMNAFDFSNLANGAAYYGTPTYFEVDRFDGNADVFLGFGFTYFGNVPVSGIVQAYGLVSPSSEVIAQITGIAIPMTDIVAAANTPTLVDDFLVIAAHLSGPDDFIGSPFQERFVGFGGNDRLTGNGGADSFVYLGRDGKDTITDFSSNDRIDLSLIDAKEKKGGNQKFKFIGNEGFHDKAGEIRFAKHKLSGDTDGDGNAELVIKLPGFDHLDKADLYL